MKNQVLYDKIMMDVHGNGELFPSEDFRGLVRTMTVKSAFLNQFIQKGCDP
jgi:hypothetical protein